MKQITISLDDFMYLALGSELRCARVLPSLELGLVIDKIVSKDLLYKVQFNDFDGTPLPLPVFWAYPDWYESSTNYKRQKDSAEKRRIADWIFKANVKIIAARLIEVYFFPDDAASAMAYSWLKKKDFQRIKAIGVSKLITKEEELR